MKIIHNSKFNVSKSSFIGPQPGCFSCYTDRTMTETSGWPTKLKYLLSGSWQKKKKSLPISHLEHSTGSINTWWMNRCYSLQNFRKWQWIMQPIKLFKVDMNTETLLLIDDTQQKLNGISLSLLYCLSLRKLQSTNAALSVCSTLPPDKHG